MTLTTSSPASFGLAVRWMLLATLAFSVMNVFVKQLGRIPAMEIVLVRCLVSAVLCMAGLFRRGVDWKGNNTGLLFARGTAGTIALFTFFLTIQEIPLATATTIQYLSPVFTAIIGVLFLGEQVRRLQWLFYAMAFAGVFVIKGLDGRVPMLYLATGMISALASGVAYNLVRRLREREHPLVVVLHFQLVGVATGLLFSLVSWRSPTAWEWFSLVMCGLLTQFGQVWLTKALQAENVASVSILNYTGLIYALLFGVFIFGETYHAQALFGIGLVMLGVVLSVLHSRRKRLAAADASGAAV